MRGADDHNAMISGVMVADKPHPGHDDRPFTPPPVDRTDRTPLHDQVAAAIRRAIAEGEARPGERIPQAKDLAAVLGVNTNTVLRALHILRDEGLLEMGRGRAIMVAGSPEQGAIVSRMKELVEFGRWHGYQREELIAMLENLP
jgi:GntR family transcriptional regulator